MMRKCFVCFAIGRECIECKCKRLESENNSLREGLHKLEWLKSANSLEIIYQCPVCGAFRGDKHASDCWLKAFVEGK